MTTKNNMNAVEDYISETSQRELASGILKQAELDLRRFHDARSEIEREFYLDAYRWVISDDCSWPFSFPNVCQVLNLAPETVHEEVLGDLSLGTFGYWSRRCGRATRKFQISLSSAFTNERNSSATELVT